jgi:hypothetical protein
MIERAGEEATMTHMDVAEWMVLQLEEDSILNQQEAAKHIQAAFGEESICLDRFGDLGIVRPVLNQFQKLTGDRVVWVVVQGNWLWGILAQARRGR